jgi:hypothetical protein
MCPSFEIRLSFQADRSTLRFRKLNFIFYGGAPLQLDLSGGAAAFQQTNAYEQYQSK